MRRGGERVPRPDEEAFDSLNALVTAGPLASSLAKAPAPWMLHCHLSEEEM